MLHRSTRASALEGQDDTALDFGPAPAVGQGAAPLEERLRRLGGRSPARERLDAALPWAISIAGHVILVALVLLLGWSFVFEPPVEERILVVADLDERTYAPVVEENVGADQFALLPAPPPSLPAPAIPPAPDQAKRITPGAMPPAVDWSPPKGREVSFAGLRAGEVRRVAYVVDASGSLVGSLPIVLDELARSMRSLSPDQQYVLLFFQRNQAVAAPPGDRFSPATPEQIERTLRWARQRIIPTGRSNPTAALEAAMRLRPDAIFLLGTGLTGSGQYEIDQAELLSRLERINPADGSGRRRTAIHCVQFLDPDPLDTLRRIADLHGGPGSYRFLSRAELGVAPK